MTGDDLHDGAFGRAAPLALRAYEESVNSIEGTVVTETGGKAVSVRNPSISYENKKRESVEQSGKKERRRWRTREERSDCENIGSDRTESGEGRKR